MAPPDGKLTLSWANSSKMMRRIYFLLALVSMTFSGLAQRLGYVDTQAILNAIPEYKQAQAEVERLSTRWEGEVASLFEDASALQAQLEAESVLLTAEMIAERNANIQNTRDTARARQMRYFSPDGELFKKREELVAPVQALVAGAIKEVARKKKLDFVFDKGSSVSVVYANESNDITSDVLQQLGY
jgi:outer membrane protein